MKEKKFKMDFVSSETLNDKPQDKRIGFILSKVSDGSILVTDGVLKPEEEMELIKETMRKVDDGFPGIEVPGLFAYFINQLSKIRINILDFISTRSTFMFVIAEEDLMQAYSVLSDSIQHFRKKDG